jgi:hypothetical protein
LQRRKTRTRPRELGAAGVAALLLAGCGSGGERVAPQRPELPAELASRLAARSDAVAARLAAEDPCGARRLVVQLRRETIAAVNRGAVPPLLQEPLVSSVLDLESRIRCAPIPVPNDRGDGKGKGRNKHGGKGKHDGEEG